MSVLPSVILCRIFIILHTQSYIFKIGLSSLMRFQWDWRSWWISDHFDALKFEFMGVVDFLAISTSVTAETFRITNRILLSLLILLQFAQFWVHFLNIDSWVQMLCHVGLCRAQRSPLVQHWRELLLRLDCFFTECDPARGFSSPTTHHDFHIWGRQSI